MDQLINEINTGSIVIRPNERDTLPNVIQQMIPVVL